MITQETINIELDLAKRIYTYYLDKLASYLAIGSDRYINWYKDLCVLYYLTECLQSVRISNDLIYIGKQEILDEDFLTITSNIREFITEDIRNLLYIELDSSFKVKDYFSPSIPPTIVSYMLGSQNVQRIVITITEDDIDTVTLPFNISDVVSNSVKMTVNDGDPLYIADPNQEGFHIVGTNLHWHSYYNLKIGDILQIEYTLIS